MEEEETAKILKISDLNRRGRPVTGTYALTPNHSLSFSKSQPTDRLPKLHKHTPQNPNSRILKPLSHPAVLVGTLTLPSFYSNNDNVNSTIQCSCFQFTDGSATVCCDILDFYPEVIGKTIRVCAWNFIPLKCAANFGGFLEIIRWEYLEFISNSSAFSLSLGASIDCKDDLKAKYSIFGVVESLSPLSVVPCSAAGGNSPRDLRNLSGFLSKILVCECRLCRRRDSRKELQELSAQKYKGHCFVKPLTVYFCGSASSWHPVISRLIQNVVSLSGLKKKLVCIGKQDSQIMYLLTDKSSLHLPKLERNWVPDEKVSEIRGFGEVGSYAGIVTGIYMQGMVVELDQKALLLLTDHQLLVPHGLRVGAIVSVRNVHFMNPKFAWTKAVVLGACFITSIRVESFSPLEAGCYIKSQSLNLLRKFIDSLTFSARLWVLLAVTCFRKKFTGIFSEKEILGSQHSEGLAQKYITSCLSSSMYQLRHGVFMEYCKHGLCNPGNGEDYRCLKLVVPISLLVNHSETSWMRMLLDLQRMDTFSQSSSISCCGRSHRKQIRRIFCSEDIGVTLLGNLEVSLSSGRLQLSDATGSIDVVITDIPSTWDFNTIYEIEVFTIIIQGVPPGLDHLDLNLGESFTFQNILSGAPAKKETKLLLHLCYNFRDQQPRHDMCSPSTNWKRSFQVPECGRFHLLWLEHKYPLLQKLIGDEAISKRSSMFAEAILLPWDLAFAKKDEVAQLSRPQDQPRNSVKYSSRDKFAEDITIKKCKTDESSSKVLNSCCDAGSVIYRLSKCTSRSFSCSDEKHCDLSSQLKFPCLISSRSFKAPYKGFLHCTDGKAIISSGVKPDGRRVFLEFGSESFYMYERLRIGGHYVVQHDEKDVLCVLKNDRNITSSTFFVTSRTCFWSLSFSSDELLKNSDSLAVFPLGGSSVHDNEVLPDVYQQHQNSHLIFNTVSPEISSDINLFIPVDFISYLKVDIDVPHGGLSLTNIYASCQGEKDIHNGNGMFIRAPLLFFGNSHSDILLPEGELKSFHGRVLAVHYFNHDSFVVHPMNGSAGNIHVPIVSQVSGSICIHVLMDHKMARILGAQGDYMFPTGFGEGIHATFHRVLVVGEERQYLLTPASFVVVNSVNGANYLSKEKLYSTSTSALSLGTASVSGSPTGLISKITKSTDVKPAQLRCRVVTLCILILENRKAVYPSIRIRSSLPVIDIPLAGFILDNGSSSCYCWANCERAATLLRLHLQAIPHEACVQTSQRSQMTLIEKACGSTIDRLNKILRQHGRVIVKNHGSMFDSSGLDVTFSVGSDKTLSRSDEDFLRCLIINACLSPMWSIVGSRMDSTAICRLEQQLTEMGMAMLPLQHIWIAEAHHVDPLTETRERIQGLLNN